ncbi:hypothetical protein [Alienimonas californiensis]|uniref:Uncharacterized protein n=1 Tax=Alienimonas californiensis TaxID=2527989 RepID=A0A517PEV8_9PLAN|nr:hypothetical protein [Alienimonas californiensis]QDT17921.1 hypothetical protein CA12_40590 [Alienimonas californiensis]
MSETRSTDAPPAEVALAWAAENLPAYRPAVRSSRHRDPAEGGADPPTFVVDVDAFMTDAMIEKVCAGRSPAEAEKRRAFAVQPLLYRLTVRGGEVISWKTPYIDVC